MTYLLDPPVHAWMASLLATAVLLFYAWPKFPRWMIAVAALVFLALWGAFFPLFDGSGTHNKLSPFGVLGVFLNPWLWVAMALAALEKTVLLKAKERFPEKQIQIRFAFLLTAMTVLFIAPANMFVLGALNAMSYDILHVLKFLPLCAAMTLTGMLYVLIVLPRMNIRHEISVKAPPLFDWQFCLEAAAFLALALTLEATGVHYLLAQKVFLPMAPIAAALIIFFLAALMTNVAGSVAAAILMMPFALAVAPALKSDPYVFALSVLFAANAAFIPQGKAYLMKAGIPLVLLLGMTYSIITRFWLGF